MTNRLTLRAVAVVAAALWSGLAAAQVALPPTADFEPNLRAVGVPKISEIDALGERLAPFYLPGQGLTPIDTSKCTQAMPIVLEFRNKSIAAADLLSKMASQLIAIERVSGLATIQGEIGRLKGWAALALVDEANCHVAAGDRVSAAVRFVQAIELDKQGTGGGLARDGLAKLLDYQN